MPNLSNEDAGYFSHPILEMLERMRLTHSLSDRVYYIYDLPQQQTLYGTGSVANLLGYSAETVHEMGMTGLAELIHPDDLYRVSEHYQKFSTLQDGEVIEIEYRMKRANGAWCSLYSQETPLMSDKVAPTQILGMIQTLTLFSRKTSQKSTQLRDLLKR